MPRPRQSKGKGQNGKGPKGEGKSDVEMGGADYVGQDYDNSNYYPASEYWNGGFSGPMGCLNEWLGLTLNNSAQTLEVTTPANSQAATIKNSLLNDEDLCKQYTAAGTRVGNIRPPVFIASVDLSFSVHVARWEVY